MNPVQGTHRAPWTGFMNVPATAFGQIYQLKFTNPSLWLTWEVAGSEVIGLLLL